MNRRKKILAIGGLILMAAAYILPKLKGSSPAILSRLKMKKSENPSLRENLRGRQYYEIFTGFKNFNTIIIGIYNNIARAPIPVNEWDNMDTEKIKAEEKAVAITKNGPRFWVMDSIKGYSAGEMRKFCGFEFDLVGVIEGKTADLKSQLKERSLYSERTINRYTDFIYNKGQKIHELISGDGTVYTMQSASNEINRNHTIDDLDLLSDKLKLPAGWKYNVRIAKEDICHEIRGEAHVIQDDFLNTYQRNPLQN